MEPWPVAARSDDMAPLFGVMVGQWHAVASSVVDLFRLFVDEFLEEIQPAQAMVSGGQELEIEPSRVPRR